MNNISHEDENKNISNTEQLFIQYLTQWREHLDTVKYSLNQSDAINCQAFQDLVHLGKDESSRATVIAMIEQEYRTYIIASDRYRAECEVDPEKMHQDSTLQGPSTRVWNYLLAAIDPCFQEAINTWAPDRRSRDIRNAVLNHFVTLEVVFKSH